jgi:hypothetical protein
MIKHLLKNTVVGLVSCFLFYSLSNAQEIKTTPNLVQPQAWQGCLDQHLGWIWGGNRGGPCPVQRAGDGAILFSWGEGQLNQRIATTQALAGTGIQIRGYEYSWTIKNANAGGAQAQPYDPININVSLYDNTNTQVLESKTYDYGYRINDWTKFTGTEDYKTRYNIANTGSVNLTITSQDVGYWAGYYGPEINHVNLRLRYSVDICAANPLASPECPGYQEAYRQQQCSANPLFDTSCPGYQQAYLQLQCTSNPLYNPQCPGYQQAYFTQQCNLTSLYSPQCPGYQQAYFTQQCNLNALYDSKCPGYEQAYFNQQCTLNQLWNKTCPGYAVAYFDQQCQLSALYNTQCPGYQQAYLTQQCTLNQLWSTECPGYQQAYLSQQCGLNPLFSQQCPTYQQAYQAKIFQDSCKANSQSSPQCPGYKTVIQTQQVIVPLAAALPQDPVVAVTQVPTVSDPVVNQVITPQPQQPKQEPLGQGLQLPQQPRTQPATTRASAREQALTTVSRNVQSVPTNPQQQQQVNQVAEMNQVPGFDAYQSATLPDAVFYTQREIYRGAVIQDNQRAQRLLTQRSDRLHREMVDEQYR